MQKKDTELANLVNLVNPPADADLALYAIIVVEVFNVA